MGGWKTHRMRAGDEPTMVTLDPHNRRFARMLSTMIASGLVDYRYFAPWADDLIATGRELPGWLFDLTLTRYSLRAAEIAAEFGEVDATGFEEDSEDYIACLLLRVNRGELSMATFLMEAGTRADCADGPVACEWFYSMLNKLEDHEYSTTLAAEQLAVVRREFSAALSRVEPVYLELKRFRSSSTRQ